MITVYYPTQQSFQFHGFDLTFKWYFISSIITRVGSRLTTGLFLMLRARLAYRSALTDSLKLSEEGETQQIINVLEFPPSES